MLQAASYPNPHGAQPVSGIVNTAAAGGSGGREGTSPEFRRGPASRYSLREVRTTTNYFYKLLRMNDYGWSCLSKRIYLLSTSYRVLPYYLQPLQLARGVPSGSGVSQ